MTEAIFRDGSKYISTKDAAKLTGYSSDYIGQLSREGRVASIKVGRSKFICEKELLEYGKETQRKQKVVETKPTKRTVDDDTARKIKVTKVAPTSDVTSDAEKERSTSTASTTSTSLPITPLSNTGTPSPYGVLMFGEEFRVVEPLRARDLPQKENVERHLVARDLRLPAQLPKRSLSVPNKVKAVALTLALLVVGFTAGTSISIDETQTLTRVTYEAGQEVARELAHSINGHGVRSTISESLDTSVAISAEQIIETGTRGYERGRLAIEDVRMQAPQSQTAFLLASIQGIARDVYVTVSVLFGEEPMSHFAQRDGGATEQMVTVDPDDSSDNTREGLVLYPGARSLDEEEDRIESIKETFSDEVEIIEDDRGNAGIIRPLFKDKKGDDFLYVLVPIEEEEDS